MKQEIDMIKNLRASPHERVEPMKCYYQPAKDAVTQCSGDHAGKSVSPGRIARIDYPWCPPGGEPRITERLEFKPNIATPLQVD